MHIEILSTNLDSLKIVLKCKTLFPDIKIDENKSSDFRRLLKKLVRERNVILKMSTIHLSFVGPLFVYYDIRNIIPCHWNIDYILSKSENITFESSEEFNDAEETALVCLFKKVKSVTKNMDEKKLKYFLPMSCHVTFSMFLDLLQVYEFLSRLMSKTITDSKMKEFRTLLMKTLNNENCLFFNEQLLDIYQANEEMKQLN